MCLLCLLSCSSFLRDTEGRGLASVTTSCWVWASSWPQGEEQNVPQPPYMCLDVPRLQPYVFVALRDFHLTWDNTGCMAHISARKMWSPVRCSLKTQLSNSPGCMQVCPDVVCVPWSQGASSSPLSLETQKLDHYRVVGILGVQTW